MEMTDDKLFADTNFVLRSAIPQMDQHLISRRFLAEAVANGVALWISGQVLREFAVQVTHPKTLIQPLTAQELEAEVRSIRKAYRIANDTPRVRRELLNLIQTYDVRGKQIHDANIVATMLTFGIRHLVTFNVADFQRYADRITILTPS